MKKIFFLALSAIFMVACNNSQNADKTNEINKDSLRADSLQNALNQKNEELQELLTSYTEIQDGFARITEAEGRINTLKNSGEETPDVAKNIQENMNYIAEIMKENKERIAMLQSKLQSSTAKTAELESKLIQLQEQFDLKVKEIADLQKQLAEKDIHIQDLNQAVETLKEEKEGVEYDRDVKEQVVNMQDAQLNTAYYVYGTKSELKEHKILDGSEVLKGNFDKAYFTKIDIRQLRSLPLNSKTVEILTNHPAGSYRIDGEKKEAKTLVITDPAQFWSISKYLVVKVK